MTDGALFGLELRRARERRGLSLGQLAEATKVSASLFAGLERGDLARWPGGIFRRAFVRSYAQSVGLDPDETLSRFLRVHPDTDGASAIATAPAPCADGTRADAAPRLVLDHAAAGSRAAVLARAARPLGAAGVDLLLAGVPALAAGAAFGWQWFAGVAAGIGLVGHPLALSLMGATPGTRLLLARPAAPNETPVVQAGPSLPAETDAVGARRSAEAEPAVAPAAPRRRPRHASGSASRPVPAGRSRRLQH